MTPIILVVFIVVAAVTFAVGLVLLRLLSGVSSDRFALGGAAASASDVSILRWDDRSAPQWRGRLERIGRWLVPKDLQLLGRYRRRLILGGFHTPNAVALFLGSKIAIGIGFSFLYVMYGIVIQRALSNVLGISLLLGALGFILPDVWLKLRTRQRQTQVSHALPDVLDMLMVCVEAGMGFDSAVSRVAENPGSKRGPLHEELSRMQLEIRAGRPREEALRAFSDRIGTEEIRSVVGSFIQTDRLGTPLGKTLRVQAEASRIQRRHRAEKRAQLVPLLMLGPTIVFLLPSFMMVAMAPSLIRILQILGTIGKR